MPCAAVLQARGRASRPFSVAEHAHATPALGKRLLSERQLALPQQPLPHAAGRDGKAAAASKAEALPFLEICRCWMEGLVNSCCLALARPCY